jgi:FKBP-type peptidyl-prolyl cis-trans isomerase FkpA
LLAIGQGKVACVRKGSVENPRMANLQMELLEVGSGALPEPGQVVVVHYTGWLTDGTKFDSSVDRNEAFEVAAGVGQVIAGWDMVLVRMRVGDKMRVTIPPELGYGANGVGGVIPPNAILIFEIELVEVK